MRYALAAIGFINGDIAFNQAAIIQTLRKCRGNADMVIFGEAFLQGFYAINFDVKHDQNVAIPKESPYIEAIRSAAGECSVGVSFGFIEKERGVFYSSQMTIDRDGRILDLYRRISPGWKEPFAGAVYREGKNPHEFIFMGKRIVVALCGDLWFDDILKDLKNRKPDMIWWPAYTDFTGGEWNQREKYAYAKRANETGKPVFYINSFCIDKAEEEQTAKGGAAFFMEGRIQKELPSGSEGILTVTC